LFWIGAIAKDRQRGETDRFTGEELVSLQDKDIFSMQPGQLDQYLDFYADTFLDNAEIQRTRENDDFRNALYQMFPTEGEQDSSQLPHGLPSEDGLKMVQSVHSNMRAMTTVDDAEAGMDTVRPGQLYPLYKNEQDLPAQARQFYEEVARLAGLSMEMLIMAVFATEGRVEKWRRKQRKEGGD
jgi:RNA polymerase I-specific transcription initiation factor RRN7